MGVAVIKVKGTQYPQDKIEGQATRVLLNIYNQNKGRMSEHKVGEVHSN